MDQINYKDYWIDAYLEWMNLEGRAVGVGSRAGERIANAGTDASVNYAVAYLEWMDEAQDARESRPRRYADALVASPGCTGDVNGRDASRETALLAALRTRGAVRAYPEPEFSH